METGIKSSFIPSAPLSAAPLRRPSGGGSDFIIVIALVFFVASATLAVGVFLYSQFLNSSVTSKLDQLERAKAAFEPALINELTRLDDRMRVGDQVLAAHIAPTALFKLLEQLTLQTVAFSSFSFDASDRSLIKIDMDGVASSVNSVALQADLLSKSGVVVNPIFSNINRQVGGIRFDFAAEVNADTLNYRNSVAAPAPIIETVPEGPPSPFGVPGGAVATSTP